MLRIEDLDPPRVAAGAEASQRDDLAWLGLRFDEGPDRGPHAPYRQSERTALYEAAIEQLAARGLTYLCDCSRAEIARVASAPHVGDEGPRYPGTCRTYGMRARAFRRPPAVRLAVPTEQVVWCDARDGWQTSDVASQVGDYVLRRGDGVFAYQLAVVVDDVAMEITEVVRGADLASSAPRQAQLARLLGADPPTYLHVPMLLGPTGERLSKRLGGSTVRERRDAGHAPAELLRAIACAYGQRVDSRQDVAGAVAEAWDLRSWDRTSVGLDAIERALTLG